MLPNGESHLITVKIVLMRTVSWEDPSVFRSERQKRFILFILLILLILSDYSHLLLFSLSQVFVDDGANESQYRNWSQSKKPVVESLHPH